MKKSREIAYIAILCALIAVLVLIGFVQIIPGVISIAVLPLLVVMLAPQMFGLKIGVISSTFFGVMSFINSFIQPSYLADFIRNPMVSIFPRVIVGLVVFWVFTRFTKLFQKSRSRFLREFLPSGLASALGVCTNTLLFLGMMWLFYGGTYIPSKGMTVTEIIPVIIAANFVVELVVCALLVPPLRYGVVRAMSRNTTAFGNREEKDKAEAGSENQKTGERQENPVEKPESLSETSRALKAEEKTLEKSSEETGERP